MYNITSYLILIIPAWLEIFQRYNIQLLKTLLDRARHAINLVRFRINKCDNFLSDAYPFIIAKRLSSSVSWLTPGVRAHELNSSLTRIEPRGCHREKLLIIRDGFRQRSRQHFTATHDADQLANDGKKGAGRLGKATSDSLIGSRHHCELLRLNDWPRGSALGTFIHQRRRIASLTSSSRHIRP